MTILAGWVVGLITGTYIVIFTMLGLGFVLPAFLLPFASLVVVPVLPIWLVVLIAVSAVIAVFLIAYLLATTGIAPLLLAATGLTTVVFPAGAPFAVPAGVPVTIPASLREFFGRGMLIGLAASINALINLGNGLLIFNFILATWAYFIISLSAFPLFPRSRIYQGFLGWSAWLFPLSWLATGVGSLLFIVNIPFAFASFGTGAFAIDWTTGVIETRGGLVNITGFNGGFSLGNFNFLSGTGATGAGPVPTRFISPSVSSHETGHSLNTAAMGGIVLWINAVDENVVPRRVNLAYGELLAESHTRVLPGTPRLNFSVRRWF